MYIWFCSTVTGDKVVTVASVLILGDFKLTPGVNVSYVNLLWHRPLNFDISKHFLGLKEEKKETSIRGSSKQNWAEVVTMHSDSVWMNSLAAVTLLGAAVPLVEVAAEEDEAPLGVRRLAETLDKRKWHKMVSRCGAAAKV